MSQNSSKTKRIINKRIEGTIASSIQTAREHDVQPDAIPSSFVPSTAVAATAHLTLPAAPAQRPVAFVEKDFYPTGSERDQQGTAALPETITSAGDPDQQRPTTNHGEDNTNTNKDRLIVKREDSLSDTDTGNNHEKRRNQGSKMPIKSEELVNNDDVNSTNRLTRRGKRKQYPSEGVAFINPIDNIQTNKKKIKRNKHKKGGEPAVVMNNTQRTSPRRNKKPPKGQEEEDSTIATNTNDDHTSTNNNNNKTKNCCQFCNDPGWENKIYYKCGTVLSKYFPISNNNPNPGWYKGTIQMHHVSSSSSSNSCAGSDSEYEDEADSISEEEKNERQQIIYNEIHYDDGDTENITQDDLKLQLMGGRKVKILLSTKMVTVSNSERQSPGNVGPPATLSKHKLDNVVPTTTASDNLNFYDKKWLENYYRLKKFKSENGHCLVPKRYGLDPSLGLWVRTQRVHYKKGKMSTDRVSKLDKIGFEWAIVTETPDQAWQEKYDRLIIFKAENGHCLVPTIYGPDPSLGMWVSNQRQTYKKGKLAKDRAMKLEEIGFDWDAFAETWEDMFGRLKLFKAENGNCRVPPRYGPDPSLGYWVSTQRKFCREGKLAEDRVEKLNKLGFAWDTFDQTWDEMFGRLKRFKAKNGHCRVPARYSSDPSLGRWVRNQRENRNTGKLAEDRTDKLNKIGFDWDARAETWDEMFGRLEQFKTENGHCHVPQRYGPDPSLGSWVHVQRRNYKKGSLAEERADKLVEIGFKWGMRNC